MPEDLVRLADICRAQAASCVDRKVAKVLLKLASDYERRAIAKKSSIETTRELQSNGHVNVQARRPLKY